MRKYLKVIGSLLNLWGRHYQKETNKILKKSVNQALREDFEKVGQDFKNALTKYKQSRLKRGKFL